MSYLGSWKIDDTPTFVCNTHNPANGSAQDADSVPSYHVYEDETSTPLLTGTMSLLNGANTHGFYSEQIVLSASSGFEKGKSYNIYIQAVVGGVTGTINRNFQIEAEVDANRINWANIDNPYTTVMLSGTSTKALEPQVHGNKIGVDGAGVAGANVVNWNGSAVATPTQNGVPKVDLTHIDGLATSGNNATLNLKKLNIQNVSGTAAVFESLGNNGFGVYIHGHGTGHGLDILGGNSSPSALGIDSGNAAGNGVTINANSPVGTAVYIGSAGGAGLFVEGGAKGAEIYGYGGDSVYLESSGGVSINAPQDIQVSDGELTLTAIADSIWDELLSGHLTPGSAGHTLFSRMPSGTVLVGDKTGFYLATPQSFDLIGNISGTFVGNHVGHTIGNVTGTLIGNIYGNVTGSVLRVTEPVGISTGSFINAVADQVWNETLSQHLTAGSTGEQLNAAGAGGDPWATALPGAYVAGQAGHFLASRQPTGSVVVAQNLDKTGYFLGTPQAFDNIGNTSGTITNVLNVVNPVGISTGSFINAIADQVWDETLSGHLLAGSTGDQLNDAGSAGDPWSTTLPGSYTAGQAGHFLASRQPTGTVIVSSNQDKTGYSLSSPQTINIIGNITGTITNVVNPVTVTGTVQADVKKINGTTLTGDGSSTPWGPA